MKKVIFCTVFVSLLIHGSKAVKIQSRPSVYVVTPSPRSHQSNEARSAPFYYHNWRRRMDAPRNDTTTTTSTPPNVKTPDLIFAEFDSDNNMHSKSIRKLLEQERVASKTSTVTTTTTTTSQPTYVPDANNVIEDQIYSVPTKEDEKADKNSKVDMTDYFALYNNLYNAPSPVYLPKTSSAPTTTTPAPVPSNVENIWHIIDNENQNEDVNRWEEIPLNSNKDNEDSSDGNKIKDITTTTEAGQINADFALLGFGTNPGKGAENESRAIRTEPNFRFPYVSLKPFQVKNTKKPSVDMFHNSKQGSNMLTSLDNFREIRHPVRGEVQEGGPKQPPIDRYNPAQPYLPQEYGSKSKQSSPESAPPKAVASLVPPPPPLPKATGDDFPAPTNYESFPPYVPAGPSPVQAPPAPPAFNPPVSMYRPPADSYDDSGPDQVSNDDDNSPIDLSYRYKSPSPSFLPTLPPLTKPFKDYSYDKPGQVVDTPPDMDTSGYTYKKPPITFDSPPHTDTGGYSYTEPQMDSPPVSDDKPDFHGFHYDNQAKPGVDSGPSGDDSGFPYDFPGDFKFHHHDFDDDHDFYHDHHHHPTTTTETPRVNRYSYYYLGKKLYYLPLYFSVYFIVYVGALIIKAVLRHKIVYPNSWKPDGTTATFFSKRSVDSWNLTNENLHEITGKVTKAIADAAKKYMNEKTKYE